MNRRILTLFLAFNLIFMLAACGKGESARQVYVMDSAASLRLFVKDEDAADELCRALYEMDDELSAYKGTLAEINKNAGGELSDYTAAVLNRSLELYEKTNGAFSPVLGSVIELWDIGGKNYVPTAQEIKAALKSSGISNVYYEEGKVILENGAELNFGAIAKGYASDVCREILIKHNVESAVISLGGNVYVHGKKPGGESWNIAIRDPAGSGNDWLGSLALSDMFVISSGDYERYFESGGRRYHHIIDPETGKPAECDLAAVAVVCENGAQGDAYSTALYVMGREKALSFWREHGDFELVLVGRDGVVTVTEGIADVFVPNEGKGYSYETAYR